MFKIRAAGLCYLVAFFTTHAMLFNDKTDVVNDILLADSGRRLAMIMGEKKPHLLRIIADGPYGILLCQKRVVQLLKANLCLLRQRYFAVLIFFA